MKSHHIIFLIAITLLQMPTAFTCWMGISLKTYAQESPIIIAGEIIEIKPLEKNVSEDRPLDVVKIKVTKIYKDVLTDSNLSLDKPFSVHQLSSKITIQSSIDIIYKLGTKGIWLIKPDKKGDFYIGQHPTEHQPMKKEPEIIELTKNTLQIVTQEHPKGTQKRLTTKNWLKSNRPAYHPSLEEAQEEVIEGELEYELDDDLDDLEQQEPVKR